MSTSKRATATAAHAHSAKDGKTSGPTRGRRRNGARRAAPPPMPSSLEIAQEATLRPIDAIGEAVGLTPEELEPYGRYKAKNG